MEIGWSRVHFVACTKCKSLPLTPEFVFFSFFFCVSSAAAVNNQFQTAQQEINLALQNKNPFFCFCMFTLCCAAGGFRSINTCSSRVRIWVHYTYNHGLWRITSNYEYISLRYSLGGSNFAYAYDTTEASIVPRPWMNLFNNTNANSWANFCSMNNQLPPSIVSQ